MGWSLSVGSNAATSAWLIDSSGTPPDAVVVVVYSTRVAGGAVESVVEVSTATSDVVAGAADAADAATVDRLVSLSPSPPPQAVARSRMTIVVVRVRFMLALLYLVATRLAELTGIGGVSCVPAGLTALIAVANEPTIKE